MLKVKSIDNNDNNIKSNEKYNNNKENKKKLNVVIDDNLSDRQANGSFVVIIDTATNEQASQTKVYRNFREDGDDFFVFATYHLTIRWEKYRLISIYIDMPQYRKGSIHFSILTTIWGFFPYSIESSARRL